MGGYFDDIEAKRPTEATEAAPEPAEVAEAANTPREIRIETEVDPAFFRMAIEDDVVVEINSIGFVVIVATFCKTFKNASSYADLTLEWLSNNAGRIEAEAHRVLGEEPITVGALLKPIENKDDITPLELILERTYLPHAAQLCADTLKRANSNANNQLVKSGFSNRKPKLVELGNEKNYFITALNDALEPGEKIQLRPDMELLATVIGTYYKDAQSKNEMCFITDNQIASVIPGNISGRTNKTLEGLIIETAMFCNENALFCECDGTYQTKKIAGPTNGKYEVAEPLITMKRARFTPYKSRCAVYGWLVTGSSLFDVAERFGQIQTIGREYLDIKDKNGKLMNYQIDNAVIVLYLSKRIKAATTHADKEITILVNTIQTECDQEWTTPQKRRKLEFIRTVFESWRRAGLVSRWKHRDVKSKPEAFILWLPTEQFEPSR